MPPRGKKRGSNPPTGPAKKPREQSPTAEAGQSSAVAASTANTQSEEGKASSHIEALVQLWRDKTGSEKIGLVQRVCKAMGIADPQETINGLYRRITVAESEAVDAQERIRELEKEAEATAERTEELERELERELVEKEDSYQLTRRLWDMRVRGLERQLAEATRAPPSTICLYPAIATEPVPPSPLTMSIYPSLSTDPSPPAPSPSQPSSPPPPSKGKKERVQRRQTLNSEALVVHGVPCHRKLSTVAQEVGQAVGVGGIVKRVRWLVSEVRRNDKATSTVVIYFDRLVGIPFRGQPNLEIRNRKHRIERYEFGRPRRRKDPGEDISF